MQHAGLAVGLAFAAGLSTAVGAAVVFQSRLVRLTSKRVLAGGLGFSGGVMLYVSFVDIFPEGRRAFREAQIPEGRAYFLATLCLFGGMCLMGLIGLVAYFLDPDHEGSFKAEPAAAQEAAGTPAADAGRTPQPVEERGSSVPEHASPTPSEMPPGKADAKLRRMGLKTAAAIALHNFPEGLATFVGTLVEPRVGATLAVAIAIHNVPEGICVALPIYYATGSRLRAFLWGLLSGLSEPVGALIGLAIIESTGRDLNRGVYGVLFCVVAGMMIMIVLSELLPTAYRYDVADKLTTGGVILGMAVMAASVCLFQASGRDGE